MQMKYLFIFACLLNLSAAAQFPGGNKDMAKAMKDIKGRVYGKIIDAKTRKPVEYATVVVLWYNRDSLLSGALTEENGDFNVENLPPMGGFRLRASQVGYKTYETKIYIQLPNKLEQDLGDIGLEIDEKMLSQVEVVAEKGAVTMSIDKRSYNVDRDLTSKGGTAADVMKNIPGVTVDADGNAQLRNQSPTIFIDGRPTNLTLQQIPADQIERVEIITNPSVKYDASSTGGILNIIMKKNLKPGYNGMVMAYAGTSDRYGGMVNLNLKEGRFNVTTMYSYNQAINNTLGYTRRTQLDSAGGTLGYFNQDNEARLTRIFNFGRIGIDYAVNNRNTVSLNGAIMGGRFSTDEKQLFSLSDGSRTERMAGTRINDQNSGFENYNGQLMYKKTFPKPGKEITTDFNYNYTSSGNNYLFTTYTHGIPDTVQIPDTYQKNNGKSNANQFVFQADYTNPVSETRKVEGGVKSYYKTSLNANSTSNATSADQDFVHDSVMSNNYVIDDMINAAYVNYSDKTFWDISCQAGL